MFLVLIQDMNNHPHRPEANISHFQKICAMQVPEYHTVYHLDSEVWVMKRRNLIQH